MRLIDADALINEIKHKLWDWESIDGITATTVLKQTITDIENQPTALLKEQDAVEPRWFIDAHNPAGAFRCGACGERIIEKDFDFYCSKCGKPILWEGR